MGKHEKSAMPLDRRVPQASEAAQLDRRLSWSGRIHPEPPCRDLDVLARVRECLYDL